jgi:hypothetical protein
MALKITSAQPASIVVPLGGGAVWNVRPASSFEVSQAFADAQELAQALKDGEGAAAQLAMLFGEQFLAADFTKPTWIVAACERLSLYLLVKQCSAGWDGVIGADDKPLPCDDGAIMLALRDPGICKRISEVVQARYYEESAEGNGSAASPSGGAAEVANTAPAAGSGTPPAPAA